MLSLQGFLTLVSLILYIFEIFHNKKLNKQLSSIGRAFIQRMQNEYSSPRYDGQNIKHQIINYMCYIVNSCANPAE
jgi:hypothetical protein